MNITQELRKMQVGEILEIAYTVCKPMTIRTLAARIGGKWKISEKGLTTKIIRL